MLILQILKWIGIIVSGILAVLIALVLLVLFLPIRYRFAVAGNQEKQDVTFRASWLLHVISFSLLRKGELKYHLRVCGIKVFPQNTAKRKPKKEVNKKATKRQEKDVAQNKVAVQEKTIPKGQPETKRQAETKRQPATERKGVTEQKKSGSKIHKIKTFLLNFRYFKERLKEPENLEAIKKIVRIFGKTIKHILPRKFFADITFGLEDPATTGEVLGILSVFYTLYADAVHITPDFTQKIIEGEARGKGRIRVFTLLRLYINLVRDNNYKHLKKSYDRWKEEFGDGE
ncbi:MAG: DUF2953 domain-containing protein [Lachnospiraceae bacterium]|nr:DUF2953 domain-containing protein [Lachnospiraceae bacterium]